LEGEYPVSHSHPALPAHISGVIKRCGVIIPIVDLAVKFHDRRTKTLDRPYAFLVGHEFQAQHLRTAILIGDLNDVQLVANGNLASPAAFQMETNLLYFQELLEGLDDGYSRRFLAENHLLLRHFGDVRTDLAVDTTMTYFNQAC
jgi:chemotaxis signal transduction protein